MTLHAHERGCLMNNEASVMADERRERNTIEAELDNTAK